MNFDAIKKISSTNVLNLLNANPKARATKQYLVIVHYVIEAFLSKSTLILDRIYYIWYCTFFLRIWRNWIKDNKFSTEKNCNTLNSYTCIELNAHGMLRMLEKCHINNDIDSFLPWLFSSQPCEKVFRETRSMTSTFSTVVNFSLYDITKRLTRIQALNEISYDLGKSKSLLPQIPF